MSARPPIGSSRPRITSVFGVSDRVSMPRIGKIRLGEKKISAGGKEYPTETDYFRLDPDQYMAPEDRQQLIDRFTEVYGERAQILRDVYFPSDAKEFVFPQGLEWWGKTEAGAKKLCEGNGAEAVRLDVKNGGWNSRPCCQAAPCAEWDAGNKCKLMSRLRIFLPSISVSGYFQIDTSSQVGTGNVLDLINHMLKTFGRLTSIPLVLSREPKPIVYEGKTTTHYVLVMRAPNINLDEFKQIVSRNQFALAAPADVDLEIEPEDVPEELVPATVQEPSVDPELLDKISMGFDLLGMSVANRAANLHRFKGNEAALLEQIKQKVAAKNAQSEVTA
jgi:hypothetical protein